MKSINIGLYLAITLGLGFSGCGSDSSSSAVEPTNQEITNSVTGIFVDSAVEGLNYSCNRWLGGVTNSSGEFTCERGDTVSFSLGDIPLREVGFANIITPQVLFQGDEKAALNFSQLIQTLDSDGDPSNGIIINDNIVETLGDEIDFTADSFDETMNETLSKLELVTAEDAQQHLDETFAELDINPDGSDRTSEPEILPDSEPEPNSALNWLNEAVHEMIYPNAVAYCVGLDAKLPTASQMIHETDLSGFSHLDYYGYWVESVDPYYYQVGTDYQGGLSAHLTSGANHGAVYVRCVK